MPQGGLHITPDPFLSLPGLWVWLTRTSLAQAATLPSQCPAHTQHLLIIRNNIWQAARLQTPQALLTCSPTVEADCMLSRRDRKGVIRKWFIFLSLNEDSHWGLPITQSMAGALLPASGSLLFFLFFNNMCKKVGCTLFLPFVASSGPEEEIKPEKHLRKSSGSDGWILHGGDWRQKYLDEVHA